MGRPDSPERLAGVARWAEFLAGALVHACEYGSRLKAATAGVWRAWSDALPDPTPAQRRLMEMLGCMPVVNAKIAAEGIGVDERTARRAISRLVQHGILKQRSAGARNRMYHAEALLQCVDAAVSRAFDAVPSDLVPPSRQQEP